MARRVEKDPQPVKLPERGWTDAVEQIVSSDHAKAQGCDPAKRKPDDQGHDNHAPAENPNHAAVRPWRKSPGKVNDGELEEDKPESASNEKTGQLL